MKIIAQAPTRIDFAGGTLDIPPLFELHEFGVTVNIAINKFATVTIEEMSHNLPGFEFIAKDLNISCQYGSLDEVKNKPERTFELLSEAVVYFKPKERIRITTSVDLPKGSGLAGSSALIIAICGALNEYTGKKLGKEELIETARNIEEKIIKTTAGWQDYYPAMYGGMNILKFDKEGCHRNTNSILGNFHRELEDRLILCYTGEPHFSGTNNQEILEKRKAGDEDVTAALEAVKQTAIKMKEAIISEDIEEFANLLNQDWENRKRLSPGVTTDQIEKLIKVAFEKGAKAARVCGAGGGGCMIVLADGNRLKIEKALIETGAKVLDYKFDYQGLQVESGISS